MSKNYDLLKRPGYQLGPYTIERLIGEGGMGQVYQGYEISTQRPVAIKVISQSHAKDQTMVQRFLNEGKALSLISSPHVVTVYSVGEDDGFNFIAMEYIEGRSLAEICANYALPGPEAAPLFIQMLKGLEALNAKGIVHRDLKPQNILFQKDNVIKILDLGIAKVYGTQTLGATSTGMIVGTVQYIAPEIAAGQPATFLSDMWSLGAILYEMVCGTPLIRAASPIEALRKLATLKIIFPPEIRRLVDPDMQLIIQKLCDPMPQRRYNSVQLAITDLENYSKKHPPDGLWNFKFIGSQVSNAEKVKKDLERKGYRPFTVKRILIEAISDTSSIPEGPVDTDKTLSLVHKDTITIKDASIKSAITRLKMVQSLPTAPAASPWKLIGSIGATVIVLLLGTAWLKWGRHWSRHATPATNTVSAPQPKAAVPAAEVSNNATAVPDAPAVTAAAPAPLPPEPEKAVDNSSSQTVESVPPPESAPLPPPTKRANPNPAKKAEPFTSTRPKIKNRQSLVTLKFSRMDSREPASAAKILNPPTLSWESVPKATEYRVELAQDPFFKDVIHRANTSTSTFKWEEPRLGTYHWRVKAVSDSGQTSFMSDAGELRVRVQAPQLPAHTKVTASSEQGSPVDLKWAATPMVNKYRVHVSSEANGEGNIVDTFVSTPQVRFDVKPGQYWVAVTATDLKGNALSDRSPSASVTMTRIATEMLDSPELLSPPDSSSIFVSNSMAVPTVFYWKVAPRATHYEIQVSKDNSFSSPVLATSHQTNRLIVNQQFRPGTYYWRVRSKSAKAASNWSPARLLRIEQASE